MLSENIISWFIIECNRSNVIACAAYAYSNDSAWQDKKTVWCYTLFEQTWVTVSQEGKIWKKKRSYSKQQPTNKSSRPRGQRSKTISHLKMIEAKTCSLRMWNNVRRFQQRQNQDAMSTNFQDKVPKTGSKLYQTSWKECI